MKNLTHLFVAVFIIISINSCSKSTKEHIEKTKQDQTFNADIFFDNDVNIGSLDYIITI